MADSRDSSTLNAFFSTESLNRSVVVVTTQGKFTGDLCESNVREKRFRLANVTYLPSGAADDRPPDKIPNRQDFYARDVLSCHFFEDEALLASKANMRKPFFEPRPKPQHLENQEILNAIDIVKHGLREAEKLFGDNTELVRTLPNHMVIDAMGDDFRQAIGVLSASKKIAFAFEGVRVGRFGKICWTAAMPKWYPGRPKPTVYLFNIQKLDQAVFQGAHSLGGLFANRQIKKIMHDCRFVHDCLANVYGVDVAPSDTEDTMVGSLEALKISHNGLYARYVDQLEKLFQDHVEGFIGSGRDRQAKFVFPRLWKRENVEEEDEQIWCMDPLPIYLQRYLVLCVMYLPFLCRRLYERMHEDYRRSVSIFSTVVRRANSPDADLYQKTMQRLVPGDWAMRHEETRRRRQEAMDKIAIGADGLLESVSNMMNNKIRYSRDTWHRSMENGETLTVEEDNVEEISDADENTGNYSGETSEVNPQRQAQNSSSRDSRTSGEDSKRQKNCATRSKTVNNERNHVPYTPKNWQPKPAGFSREDVRPYRGRSGISQQHYQTASLVPEPISLPHNGPEFLPRGAMRSSQVRSGRHVIHMA